MQIITEDMMGWDLKEKEDGKGVLGIPVAYGGSMEEKDRDTLHIHIIMLILYFNAVQNNLFLQDGTTRKRTGSVWINM